MAEQMTKPFIIILTFIATSAMLITITSEVTSWNYNPKSDELLEGWETIGGFDYNFWLNDDDLTTGYDVDPADDAVNDLQDSLLETDLWLKTEYDEGDDYYKFEPPYGNSPEIRVWIIRNNTCYRDGSTLWWRLAEDFFLLTRHTQQWPINNVRRAVIPFDDVFRSDLSDNRTYVSVKLGQLSNVTLFLNASSDLAEAIQYNFNYTVRIGTPFGTQIATASMWTALGQLLTLRLPNCHPALNALMAIPLWAGIGFLAVTIVSRFIPFVGGG